MPAWWPTLRAALITLHVCAIALSAFPSPEGGLNRKNWSEPTVQAELAGWAGRFGMKPADFEARLWGVASSYGAVSSWLLTPVRPYERLVGSEQNWKMFVAPHRYPTRLEIAGRPAGGDWRVLFYESDPTATWREEMLRTERLRASIFRWGWSSYRSAWVKACSALGRLALEDYPELDEIRLRFWKAPSPSPAEARSGALPGGAWVYGRLVRRGPDGVPLPSVPADNEPTAAQASPAVEEAP